jgi:hypothetical protein
VVTDNGSRGLFTIQLNSYIFYFSLKFIRLEFDPFRSGSNLDQILKYFTTPIYTNKLMKLAFVYTNVEHYMAAGFRQRTGVDGSVTC